jgi:hypothetical protein
MPYLIIPSGSRRIRPTTPLRINWASELALGLRHVFMCDGNGMTDLVTRKRYPATGGSLAVSKYGIGWKSGGSGTRITGPTGVEAQKTGDYRVGSGISVILQGKFTAGSFVAVAIANGFNGGQGGWSFRAPQYPFTGHTGFSSPGVGSDYDSGLNVPTDNPSIISLRMASSGTSYYQVGVSAPATSANAAPSNVGDKISIGAGHVSGSDDSDPLASGDCVYWAAIYNRDLPVHLLDRWHMGPFGDVIVADNQREYFFPASGGAAPVFNPMSGRGGAAARPLVN